MRRLTGSIAALSMAAAMVEIASRGAVSQLDGLVGVCQFDRGRRQAAQWKRETGQVKRKGRQ